jgi:hypothetical protein
MIAQVFSNYIEANIVMGRLEEEGIECWLQDENMVTTAPFLGNAVGGIKLMVAEKDFARTIELLKEFDKEKKQLTPCPKCGSTNVEFVTTPRKATNWFWALFGFLFGDYAIAYDKVYHCFNCKNEFAAPEETGAD